MRHLLASSQGLTWGPRVLEVNTMRISSRRRISFVCAAARNQSESLYQILGVSPGADDKEIKRAYRRLALKFHPDVNKEPDAQEKFMRIKQAYQTLVDPSTRRKYESSKRASERRQSYSTKKQDEDFYGLGDLFRDLQVSLEEFFRDLQAEFQKRETASTDTRPKSLWEELAELGEEFLEFLEKELNIEDSNNKETNTTPPKEESSKVESEIDEIEELLTKLKDELGLK